MNDHSASLLLPSGIGGMVLFAIAQYAILAFVLYVIIQYATKAKAIKRNSDIQVRLLMKIAEKQGVSPAEITQCLNS